jgi:hypothetical protein
MNINLAQANGLCLTRWQMRALKHLAGAKARVDFGAICGTTKVVPCYKANPCRGFSGKAGASLIFIFHYSCRVGFVVSHPFHKEREKDGARSFLTPSVKMV